MKTELKHIAPYLPYGLKFYDIEMKNIYEVLGLYEDSITLYSITEPTQTFYFQTPLRDFRLLLRPMKDLHLKRFLNGRETTSANELYMQWDITDMLFNGHCENPMYGYEVYCYLFKHHFDVFGLIEQGLAIDINTI